MKAASVSEKAKIVCGSAVLRYSARTSSIELLTIFKKRQRDTNFLVERLKMERQSGMLQ